MQLTLMRVGGHEEHGRHEGHIRKNIIACGENRAKLRTAYGENRAKLRTAYGENRAKLRTAYGENHAKRRTA